MTFYFLRQVTSAADAGLIENENRNLVMSSKNHWDQVYTSKAPHSVSWYQPHAVQSIEWIRATGLPRSASIVDVGGGAATLVDDLIQDGYHNLTVLDLSSSALAAARARLGAAARSVTWLEADITSVTLPPNAFDLWHDRAVFHFLTSERERESYVAAVRNALKPGGFLIMATFAEDGPLQCSGLAVVRYSLENLRWVFGDSFTLIQHEREDHHTPNDAVQKFLYCYWRKAASVKQV